MSMESPASKGPAGCKPFTTFVQTDTNTFREVVQRLTGPSEANRDSQERAAAKLAGIKRQTSKLHERRQYTRPKIEILTPPFNFNPASSPSKSGTRSFPASPVGTPSTIFSKLSIMEEENKEQPAIAGLNSEEEEKAIKERRFYLHPSPRSKLGYTEPELLTLFPLTSPRTCEKP